MSENVRSTAYGLLGGLMPPPAKIGAVVVHRIVATAFHGEQPSEKHIVDHIDTNRRNNRAENLRWITRLDNLLQAMALHYTLSLSFQQPNHG